MLVALASDALAESSADHEVLWPQLSYSVAVGKSDGHWLGHLWIGAGLHAGRRVRNLSGLFVLAGFEMDLRGGSESSPDDRDTETWFAVRSGVGHFNKRALAPHIATYLIVGRRLAGSTDAPTVRIGAGLSIPAALPVAMVGIPTMIECGVDGGGRASGLHGFLRLGWNF